MKRAFEYFEYNLTKLIILYLFFIITFIPSSVICAVYTELYPDMSMNASPNPVGSGARAMGLGGAFISVADDATAASWNPAGLLQLTKPEISAVGSFFTGKTDYKTSGIEGDIEEASLDIFHLNYLSGVIPFTLMRRNFVFSLNYQHIYEFYKENVYTWKELYSLPVINVSHTNRKYQKGSLYTLSPALAMQIIPSLFVGLTFNFWEKDILDNGWENIDIQDAYGIDFGNEKSSHIETYERYDFSGFNMHIGFLYKSDPFVLWGGRKKFRIGGVIKTSFKADIQRDILEISYEKYPDNPVLNSYIVSGLYTNPMLKMPFSYGLGASLDISESFSLAFDVYHTNWEEYLLIYPNGSESSPISAKFSTQHNIKSTTQIRLGAEYLIQKPGKIIPVRFGIFYDPEPSMGKPDDLYGISLGTGISYKELFSVDFAYHVRFGHKRKAESIQGQDIPGDVIQHFLYTSIIYYLF